jgi:hypothetical protein
MTRRWIFVALGAALAVTSPNAGFAAEDKHGGHGAAKPGAYRSSGDHHQMMDRMMAGMSASEKKHMHAHMGKMSTPERKKMMDRMLKMSPAERRKMAQKMMHGADGHGGKAKPSGRAPHANPQHAKPKSGKAPAHGEGHAGAK